MKQALHNAHETIRVSMRPLFEKAEKDGLWFYQKFQGRYFTPDQLKAEQAAGRFLWGRANWQLVKPTEAQLESMKAREDAALIAQVEQEIGTAPAL